MKKVIGILLIVSSIRVSAQLPVTDAAHVGINVAGWIESIAEAINSTNEIARVLGVGKETVENLQDIKNQVEKINRYILQMQEIEYAVRDIADMGSMLSEFGRTVALANTTFSMDEKRRALDMYNQVLARATRDLRALHDCVDEGKFAFTDHQRKLCLNQRAEQIRKQKEYLQAFDKKFRSETAIRGQILKADRAGLLTPAELCFYEEVPEHNALDQATVTFKMMSAMIDNYDGGDGTLSESAAKTEIKDASNVWVRVWYVLCAIIGLIGAYKVYSKVQMGDDLGRGVWLWFGAALLLYFVGILVEKFFL